jgi:hypothetical protein
MKKKLMTGVALGALLALVGGGMAMATPVSYDGSGFDFGPSSNTGGMSFSGSFYLDDDKASYAWKTAHPTQDSKLNSNFDERGFISVDDGTNNNYSDYTGGESCTKDSIGSDISVVCTDEVVNGLTVRAEVYYYGDFNVNRVVYVLKNAGATDITRNVDITSNSECDDSGVAHASNGDVADSQTTGSAGFTLTDWNWMVQGDPRNAHNCAIEGTVWQDASAPLRASVHHLAVQLDGQDIYYPVTIPAGQTIALAVFFADGWVDDGNQAADPADPTNTWTINEAAGIQAMQDEFTNNFSSWGAVASRGVASDLNVVNWSVPAEALPDTGASAIALVSTGAIAAGLLAAGALALIMVRRRQATK